MMNSLLPLIVHHQKRAARGEPYKAYKNCHALGLHSVMLHDEPGNGVRIFYADPSHELFHNRDRTTIAIHPHRRDIIIAGLFGDMLNDMYSIIPNQRDGQFLEYNYKSAILTGVGHLQLTGYRGDAIRYRTDHIDKDAYVEMKAHEMHTVYVSEMQQAAWMIIEGQEDKHYGSKCWTNGSINTAGLYEPMNQKDIDWFFWQLRYGMEDPTA